MNYIGAIVKILEIPKHEVVDSKVIVAKCRAQISQTRNIRVVNLVFWSELAIMIINNFKVNDYILIEGYTSIRENKTLTTNKKSFKKVTITVSKIYPFLLNDKSSIRVINFPR